MIAIPGYTVLAQIYESSNSCVYRGYRDSDHQSVIFKVLTTQYPTLAQIARYKLEYEITQNLMKIEGVIKAYALEKYQNRFVIILEDFGAESLRMSMQSHSLSLTESLNLMMKITQILGEVHQENIIHKDINPSNIIVNIETAQVKLIDFGIATLLSQENPTFKNPNVLEGTLAYISPEQTGRMNRSVDYRSDFYSLGVTFYELLTQQLPFEATDALELVHCHIAKQPLTPYEINPNIPQAISNIVMKLLSKTAEERYQNALGIQADLQVCLNQLEQTGNIEEFRIGSQDIPSRFQIPQKLYGREAEIESLLSAFERVNYSEQSKIEIMLIAGYSGIGKSALVQEIYKPITQKRGYFIQGKFEQFQRNIPYAAIIQAFSFLIRQLLTESQEEIDKWREQLLTALESNGKVIIDVIGEVELIIGKQPPVEELPPIESQNRFNLVFQNFIKVFTQKEHPLVVFLDDLQWADAASLKLLKWLMTDSESQYLLLIGAYRDNEVDLTHPFRLTLSEIQSSGAVLNQFSLRPLSLFHVNQLVAETLHREISDITTLAELIYQKTNGNPFFINEIFKSFYSDGLVKFDFSRGIWQWDLEQIKLSKITDNVVELMASKIKNLSASTQQVLKLAACIGNQFDLKTLSLVNETNPIYVSDALFEAVQAGLIFPIGDDYKFLESATNIDTLTIIYCFVHDRVQQAAYNQIPEKNRREVHLKIGRLLKETTPEHERLAKIFDIVDHLNLSQELITNQLEKTELAFLNLKAGKKAKDATAYIASQQYLIIGIACLTGNFWIDSYDLALALHKERADIEYLNGNFEQAEAFIHLTLSHAKTNLEKAEIYNLVIIQYTLQFRYAEAIETGKKALQLLQEELPETNLKDAFLFFKKKIEARLTDKTVNSLIELRENQNLEKRIAQKLLVNLLAPVYILNFELYFVITAKLVNLSLQYGHSSESAQGYSTYGFVLCCLENYQLAYEFGWLSYQLSEKYNNLAYTCKNLTVFGGLIAPWVQPLAVSDSILTEGYKAGLLSGEFQYAGYIHQFQAISLFCQGVNLAEMLIEIDKFLYFTQKTKNQWSTDNIFGFRLILLNLTGQTPDKLSFDSDTISSSDYVSACQTRQSIQGICYYQIAQSIVFYLYEEYTKSLQLSPSITQLIPAISGNIIVAEYYFYYALTLAAAYPHASELEQQKYLEKLIFNQQKLKLWADQNPENFLLKYLLVSAEIARITGQRLEALDFYDQVISESEKTTFIQHEAIANELMAKFWLEKGSRNLAQVYLKKAHYNYQLWGATRKAEDLLKKYPQLFNKDSDSQQTPIKNLKTTVSTTSNHSGESLDLATVVKASQAIAREILLDKLLAKLLHLVLENSGAQRGFLILSRSQELYIEAFGEVDRDINVLQAIPVKNFEGLPTTIINYVARTQENIVLSNALDEEIFTSDPYIIQNRPKSVLCSPIVHQSKLMGLLYLENNLSTDAFTSERLEILKIISSQAAISLENALLYQTLEEKVEERTAQLAQANQEIIALNKQLKAENIRLAAELEVTRKLQKMILPKQEELLQISNLEIADFMEPADEVGGDYYDILVQDEKVKIGIGDVTGHGLESGVLMLMAQTAVRTLLESNETNPQKFLDTINRTIYKNIQRMKCEKNMTLAILDYQHGTLNISGQHEEVIIIRSDGNLERIDTIDLGFPIGLDEEILDFVAQESCQLYLGDVVVLYTDGITEAEDINGELYGLDRFCNILLENYQRNAHEIKQAVIEDVYRHIGQQRVYDDITLLILKQK